MAISADRPEAAVPSGRAHRAGLDGLRGIAALAVVAGHALQDNGAGAAQQFFLAVDFFFVLSGYVVAYAYEDRLRSGRISFRRFCAVRLIRLHPLLLLGTAVLILFSVERKLRGLEEPSWTQIAVIAATASACIPWAPAFQSSLAMLRAALFPLNFPQWSLYVEYVLNFAYALFVVRLGQRALIGIILFGAAALVALVVVYGTMSGGYARGDAWVGPVRGIYPFFVGVLIHRLEQRGALPDIRLPWWIAALLLAGIVMMPVAAPAPWIELPVVLLVWPGIVVTCRHDNFGPSMRKTLLWLGAVS